MYKCTRRATSTAPVCCGDHLALFSKLRLDGPRMKACSALGVTRVAHSDNNVISSDDTVDRNTGRQMPLPGNG